MRSKLLEVASDFPEYRFAISNTRDHHTELSSSFGVSVNSLSTEVPTVAAWVGGRRYKMEAEFSVVAIRNFVRSLASGHTAEAMPDPIPKVMDIEADHFYSLKQQIENLQNQLYSKDKENEALKAEIENLKRNQK